MEQLQVLRLQSDSISTGVVEHPVVDPSGHRWLSDDSIGRILSRYYENLVEWGRILARGDDSAAEETVQDLCLHLTVAQTDLNRVQNLPVMSLVYRFQSWPNPKHLANGQWGPY